MNITFHSSPLSAPSEEDARRGKNATTPAQIPHHGWMEVLKRTFGQISHDHLPLVSAGVAFFLLLGLFPALAAIVSIYGWIMDPMGVAKHINELARIIPGEAADIIHDQVDALASDQKTAGWGAIIGVLLAIWAGSKAMKGMSEALNIAYGESESRGFIKKQAVYLGLTVGTVLTVVISILLIALLPAIVNWIPLPELGKHALLWLRWPVLLTVAMVYFAVLYRYGPDRENAEWHWLSWGAAVATLLWLGASALFSIYVSSFGNYNETYGSIGAVVVLMMWLYITAFLVLLGAELNSELELQTRYDTTGDDEPMGLRDACVADHVVE